MQVAGASLVAWTTLAMLNCANIDTVEHKAPDAFQKARKKSGKRPLVSYHTVRVDLGKTPRQIAADQLPGDHAAPEPDALHVPTFLVEPRRGAVAGSAEEGVVVSDYEVTP